MSQSYRNKSYSSNLCFIQLVRIDEFIKNIRLEHGESCLSVDNDVMYAAVWLTPGQI